jgi:competence protein ComEC
MIMGGLFVLGETACQMWEENTYLAYLMLILGGLIIWSVPKLNKFKNAFGNSYAFENKKSVCLLLFLCLISGMVWEAGYSLSTDSRSLNQYSEMDEDVVITARISWIETSGTGQWLILKTGNTGLLAYVSEEEVTEVCDVPGKYLKIRGRIEKLRPATNPGAFDMKEYYEGRNIRYRINIKQMEQAEVSDGFPARVKNGFIKHLYRLRKIMTERIDGLYDDESAAVLKTMLLGDKSSLSNETRVLYQRCGIAHVLAISGLHVALLAGAFGWILKKIRVRRRVASGFVIGFVFTYALLTGMSAPTLRAAIMLSIGEIAFVFGRTPDMPTTAIEALLIIAIVSPGSICSTGMLMSYAAVAGIICSDAFYKRLFGRERFLRVPVKFRGLCKNLIRTILMSTSINAFMLPLVMRNYYEVPIFSMLLNWIVIPMLTVIVAAGFVSIVIGIICRLVILPGAEYVKRIPISICRICLASYKELCKGFLKIPGGVYSTGNMEVWQMVVMYAVIIAFVFAFYVKCGKNNHKNNHKNNQKNNQKQNQKQNHRQEQKIYEAMREVTIYVLSILAILILSMNFVRAENIYSSRVTFLDVGQGDGSIIHQSPIEKRFDSETVSEIDFEDNSEGDSETGSDDYVDSSKSVLRRFLGANKKGRNYIIDGGSTSVKDIGKNALIPALKYYAMTDIDCIFISHTDLDHISGIIYLIENAELYGIRIRHVALATGTDKEEENYQKIKNAVEEYNKGKDEDDKKRSIYRKKPLDMLELGKGDIVDERFEVLYPSGEEEIEHSGNDYSLVLKFISDDYEILYTGDIGEYAEQRITQNGFGELRSSKTRKNSKTCKRILKVAHHGSKYSSCEEFIDSYSPDIAVISVGENNTYGHPSEQTLAKFRKKGVNVYRTDCQGAVILE